MRNIAAALVFLTICSFTQTIVKEDDRVGFRIKNMGIWVDGQLPAKSSEVYINKNDPEKSSVKILLEVYGLRTGMDERDKELLKEEWFDAGNHPHIQFKSSKITKSSNQKFLIEGDLTIKDKSSQIKVPVVLVEKKGTQYIRGKLKLNRLEFNVGKKVMGMSDVVEVHFYLPVDPLPTRSMYTGR